MQFATEQTSTQYAAKARLWLGLAALLMLTAMSIVGYAFATPGDQIGWGVIGGFLGTAGVRATVNAAVAKMRTEGLGR